MLLSISKAARNRLIFNSLNENNLVGDKKSVLNAKKTNKQMFISPDQMNIFVFVFYKVTPVGVTFSPLAASVGADVVHTVAKT